MKMVMPVFLSFDVTKLDRLARSVRDAADFFAELDRQSVALSIDGVVYDLSAATGKLMLNTLSMIAEFEADLISQRTKKGMAIAWQKGRLKGRVPKLSAAKRRIVVEQWQAGVKQTGLLRCSVSRIEWFAVSWIVPRFSSSPESPLVSME